MPTARAMALRRYDANIAAVLLAHAAIEPGEGKREKQPKGASEWVGSWDLRLIRQSLAGPAVLTAANSCGSLTEYASVDPRLGNARGGGREA